MDITPILERLVKARTQAGLSQAQVAKMFEVERTTITNWEAGLSPLTLKNFLHLCETYGVSSTWVLTGVNPDFDKEAFMKAMSGTFVNMAKLIEVFEMIATENEVKL